MKKGLRRRDRAKKIVPVNTMVGPEDEFKATLANIPIMTDSKPTTILITNILVSDRAMF